MADGVPRDNLFVDCFAGGGGASTGIGWALGRDPDIAINHSRKAIAMHKANHPNTKHYIEDIWQVKPRDACGDRHVSGLWISPDCTHHSKAKGGKPRSKKLRALAWVAVRWARDVRPDVIFLENVEEFAEWGPLGPDGKPCPERKGRTFRMFVKRLRSLGYVVEWRLLTAADFGTPTTRRRLFMIARRDGKPIVWPEPTHSKEGRAGTQRWRSAAEVIDWQKPCPSIFERKRPLAPATMRRIAAGLKRYVLENSKPFLVPVTHQGSPNRVHSVDEPMRTVTAAHRGEFAMVTPFVSKYHGGEHAAARGQTLDEPLRTVDTENRFAVVTPFIARTDMHLSNAGCVFPPEDPLRTICTAGGFAVVNPLVMPVRSHGGGGNDAQGAACAPLRTVTCTKRGEFAVVSPLVVPLTHTQGGDRVWSADAPLKTITTARGGEFALVAPTLMVNTTGHAGRSLDEPVATVTTGGHHALVGATLIGVGGPAYQGKPADVCMPLGTLLTENHRALVMPTLVQTGYGERPGQAPRVPGLDKPLGTVVSGQKHALVCAMLTKHYNGVYAQDLDAPLCTVTAREHITESHVTLAPLSALCEAAHLTKFYGTNVGADPKSPLPTVTGGGQHLGDVRATLRAVGPDGDAPATLEASHLTKFYGRSTGQDPRDPLSTVTGGLHVGEVRAFLHAQSLEPHAARRVSKAPAKGKGKAKPEAQAQGELKFAAAPSSASELDGLLGIVTLNGVAYQIVDIGLRMLSPAELFRAQGFPEDYAIAPLVDGKPLSKTAQIECAGNSVCPQMAEALVRANLGRDAAVQAA